MCTICKARCSMHETRSIATSNARRAIHIMHLNFACCASALFGGIVISSRVGSPLLSTLHLGLNPLLSVSVGSGPVPSTMPFSLPQYVPCTAAKVAERTWAPSTSLQPGWETPMFSAAENGLMRRMQQRIAPSSCQASFSFRPSRQASRPRDDQEWIASNPAFLWFLPPLL